MKEAMAIRRKNIQSGISEARKRRKIASKEKDYKQVRLIEKEIQSLQDLQKFYGARFVPVEFSNGFVLNGTFLKQFIKKLPAMKLEAEFAEDGSFVHISHKNGKLTLYNQKNRYEGLKMPKGEVLFDELGIVSH